MAKRRSVSKSSTPLEKRVVALAERMGTIAGRMQAAVEGLRSTRVRGKGRMPTATPARSGGQVDAPGKKHRKAPARIRGVKHSQQAIAKVVNRKQTRPPRRG